MISKITYSFNILQWESVPEPLPHPQGGTRETRAPGDESGTNSDYLEDPSQACLIVHTQHPIIYRALFLAP